MNGSEPGSGRWPDLRLLAVPPLASLPTRSVVSCNAKSGALVSRSVVFCSVSDVNKESGNWWIRTQKN